MNKVRQLHEIKAIIEPILAEYGIKEAAVFGSYARGEAAVDSDLDLLVELPSSATLLDQAGLKLDLEEALGVGVDVIEPDTLKPAIKDKVLSQKRQLV